MLTYNLSCDKCTKNRRITRFFQVKNLTLALNLRFLSVFLMEKNFLFSGISYEVGKSSVKKIIMFLSVGVT